MIPCTGNTNVSIYLQGRDSCDPEGRLHLCLLSALFEARSRRLELKTTEVIPVKKVTELIQRFEDEGLPKDEVCIMQDTVKIR